MEKLAWEARARITWGDSERKVERWLREAGVAAVFSKERLASEEGVLQLRAALHELGFQQ